MDGLLIIDKPPGITSHDVVARVRRVLKTKRVGHTGTLDPFATGVLVVLAGQATRLAQFLDKDEKEYEAVVQFGWETDTGDRTGQRTTDLESQISNFRSEISDQGFRTADSENRLSTVEWGRLLESFRGELLQMPPMYSAKKVEGKKLYELARQGKQIERKAVPVTIRELELLEFGSSQATACIRVVCSAGTYIRTLAEDIGRAVGLGAHLTELRRTRAGKFAISKAVTLEQLESLPDASSVLIPMNEAVAHLPSFVLSTERVAKTKNGLSSRTDEELPDAGMVRMIDADAGLIAIGEYRRAEKIVQPKVVFG